METWRSSLVYTTNRFWHRLQLFCSVQWVQCSVQFSAVSAVFSAVQCSARSPSSCFQREMTEPAPFCIPGHNNQVTYTPSWMEMKAGVGFQFTGNCALSSLNIVFVWTWPKQKMFSISCDPKILTFWKPTNVGVWNQIGALDLSALLIFLANNDETENASSIEQH